MQEALRVMTDICRHWKHQNTKAYLSERVYGNFLLSRKWRVACIVGALLLIPITIFSLPPHQEKGQLPPFTLQSLSHFTGGFSIDSSRKVVNAAEDGIEVDLKYGDPYTPQDPVGMALQANHMRLIDSIPQTYLYYYACYIHNT